MRRQWFILFFMFVILASSFGTGTPRASAQTYYVSYVVQPGDTLGKIALQYCTTWQTIYDLNQDAIGPDPNVIKAGTVLVVPANCGNPIPPSGTVYDRGPMTHATGYYSAPYYTVAWGDTLDAIGLRFGVPWQEIAAANGISGTSIYAGQVLYIPGTSSTVPPPPTTQGPVDRVYFATGASSGSVTGVIYSGVPMNYILWARAGQVMTVSTISHGEPLVISIAGPTGDLLPLSGVNSAVYNTVSTTLPQDGDYIVTVRPTTTPESPELVFDITFVIK